MSGNIQDKFISDIFRSFTEIYNDNIMGNLRLVTCKCNGLSVLETAHIKKKSKRTTSVQLKPDEQQLLVSPK